MTFDDHMRKLNELHEAGVLSDADLERAKRRMEGADQPEEPDEADEPAASSRRVRKTTVPTPWPMWVQVLVISALAALILTGLVTAFLPRVALLTAPVSCRGADHAVVHTKTERPYASKEVTLFRVECVERDGSVRPAKWVFTTLFFEWLAVILAGCLLYWVANRRPPKRRPPGAPPATATS